VKLDEFLALPFEGVFLTGHSSAIVRMEGKTLLLDPVWGGRQLYGGDYWRFAPEQVDCDEALAVADACVVSHIHEDHLCGPVLKNFKPFAWIDIMAGRPKFENRLLEWGLAYQRYPPSQWFEITPGVECYFVQHPYNDVDSSCFLRSKRTGYVVYHGNDNFLDRAALSFVRRGRPEGRRRAPPLRLRPLVALPPGDTGRASPVRGESDGPRVDAEGLRLRRDL
jgi:hypothetical protein